MAKTDLAAANRFVRSPIELATHNNRELGGVTWGDKEAEIKRMCLSTHTQGERKCLVSRKRGTDNCSTNFKLNSTMAMPGGDLSYAQCPCPGHFSTPSVASSALRRTITNNFSAFKHSSAKLINDISAKAHFNKYCQCARAAREREERAEELAVEGEIV